MEVATDDDDVDDDDDDDVDDDDVGSLLVSKILKIEMIIPLVKSTS
jgi:hypothetical protein